MSKLESAQRLLRRAARREERAAKVGENRSWFQDRIADAEVRRAERRRAREEAGLSPAALRVPEPIRKAEGLRRLGIQTEVPERGEYRGVTASYAERRRMGQRGKGRRPRRREMPGAEARRIERNQRSASW